MRTGEGTVIFMSGRAKPPWHRSGLTLHYSLFSADLAIQD